MCFRDEGVTFDRVADDHHLLRRSGAAVKELSSVRRPLGVMSAGGRDLPPSSRTRKGPDVDFELSRLVGRVGDEVPVRGESRLCLVERARQKGFGLAGRETLGLVFLDGHDEDIRALWILHAVSEKFATWMPGIWTDAVLAFE